MEIKSIQPLISQMFLTKVGLFCSERLSIDIVHLNQAIDLLLPTFDLEEAEIEYDKKFGEGSWKIVMKKKGKLVKRLAESKLFYDTLENKSFSKRVSIKAKSLTETIQEILQRFFHKTSSKIAVMQMDIYNLFVFLVSYSQVQRMQVRAEYFKNLEQKDNRSIKLDRNKPGIH